MIKRAIHIIGMTLLIWVIACYAIVCVVTFFTGIWDWWNYLSPAITIYCGAVLLIVSYLFVRAVDVFHYWN